MDNDLRTRRGREKEVVEQVQAEGGFSIFWATVDIKRAHAIARLEKAGRLRRDGGEFPWCRYALTSTEGTD